MYYYKFYIEGSWYSYYGIDKLFLANNMACVSLLEFWYVGGK